MEGEPQTLEWVIVIALAVLLVIAALIIFGLQIFQIISGPVRGDNLFMH